MKSNFHTLREQLKAGVDQLNQGEGIVIKSKGALDNLFDDIKRQPTLIIPITRLSHRWQGMTLNIFMITCHQQVGARQVSDYLD